MKKATTETIVLGAGCFWCTEAVYQHIPGVISVNPGYAGGTTNDPTYEKVCTGTTGHAEVAKVEFDPQKTSLSTILSVFFHIHDPTSLNKQGADVGTQYRSAIYYTEVTQKPVIESSKRNFADETHLSGPIVTEIKALDVFYPAETYHRDYYKKHMDAPYCQVVIRPKVDKIRELTA